MRVKFLSLAASNKIVLINDHRCLPGEIKCLHDDLAKEYIKEKIVEPFSYSISDTEIRKLYNEFNNTSEFKRKVNIFLEVVSNSIEEVLLEDNTIVVFILKPKNKEEWFIYNTQLMEYCKKKFPECSIVGMKGLFEKKLFNTPDRSKLIRLEKGKVKKTIEGADKNEIFYWYNALYNGNIPKDDIEYKYFLSKPIEFGIKNYLLAMTIADYEKYLETIDINQEEIKGKRNNLIDTLSELFNLPSEYDMIMTLLVKNNLCQEKTFIWIDEKKGNKKMLVSLIKHLHSKGYLRRKPSIDEVKRIGLNSFKIDVSIDTIKKANLDSFDFDFIPDRNNK